MNKTLSNLSIDSNCLMKQSFNSFLDFMECYKYFISKHFGITIYCIIVIFGALILNIVAIILLGTKSTKNTVFDKILISHAFVDLLTGFIDFPFLHIISIYGYWPFSKTFCISYVAFDNILATVEVFHVLYMSWSRLRCIFAPKSYSNELIINYSYTFILFLWIICCILWIPTSIVLINKDYEENVCLLSFNSILVSLLIIFLGWTIPVIITIAINFYIIYVLSMRNKKKKQISKKASDSASALSNIIHTSFRFEYLRTIKLNPQTKLTIIITPFCLQYFQYSIVWFVSTICTECVSTSLYTYSYFIAFLTSFTNPLILLLINPGFFIKKK